MKNTREIAKENTRNLILTKTKELVVSAGIINTSTKQIAEECHLAHGTIFAHFNSREELIGSVISLELMRIAEKLYVLAEKKEPFGQLLDEYLKLIAGEEDLLVVIYKEFSFLSHYIKNEIITTETIIKKFFYQTISSGIEGGLIKPLNISLFIAAIFGTISHYLTRKEYFVQSGSVIIQKKDEIVKLFVKLIK